MLVSSQQPYPQTALSQQVTYPAFALSHPTFSGIFDRFKKAPPAETKEVKGEQPHTQPVAPQAQSVPVEIPLQTEPLEEGMAFLALYGIKPKRIQSASIDKNAEVYELSPDDLTKLKHLKRKMFDLGLTGHTTGSQKKVQLNQNDYRLQVNFLENRLKMHSPDYEFRLSREGEVHQYNTRYETVFIEGDRLIRHFSPELVARVAQTGGCSEILGRPYQKTDTSFPLDLPCKTTILEGDPTLYADLMKQTLGENFYKASQGQSVNLLDDYEQYRNNPTAVNAYYLLSSHPDLLQKALETLAEAQGKTVAEVLTALTNQ